MTQLIVEILGIVIGGGSIVGWVVWINTKLTKQEAKLHQVEKDIFEYKEYVTEIERELKHFRIETTKLLTETKTVVERIEKGMKA